MAKISFGKLKLKLNNGVQHIKFNDLDIEIKQYLSVEQKLQIIGNVINHIIDENRFCNTIKLDVYLALEVIYNYTNISFTDTQKEDPVKLYDLFVSSGLYDMIIDNIDDEEITYLEEHTYAIIDNIYRQMNSFYGVMENVVRDYSQVDMDATEVQKKLNDSNNIELLKNIMTKLG